ncbi:MAG: DUF1553 domain-containing protein [Armatimonadetes bacterium]|nr:DUF1553 domain-containing protein [Armatimonadota bacterium]
MWSRILAIFAGGPLRRYVGGLLAGALFFAAAQGAGAAPAGPPAPADRPGLVIPFESDTAFVPANPVDTHVLTALKKKGIAPAHLCSDQLFIRRVYIDLTGTLPTPEEVVAFLEDSNPKKRADLVNRLLEREEFADYAALKWCDILRVKAEFPVNLWPNAVQAYHRWIREAIRQGMPYDQFARLLLTSSGSNFRVPPVNFYRAVQSREPAAIASAVALTWMGTRLDRWPEARRAGMAAFFSRIAYKSTGEWKEEIVFLNPAATDPLDAVFPDGKTVRIPPDRDPRQVFADWLISPQNPWFARAAVNRVWSWLMGRGIIHETDDIRPDNPPVNPALLSYLEKEFVASKYDLRHLYRLIVNSRTYQQSPIPRSKQPEAHAYFAYYPVRRLDAEVLIDALCWIGGTGEGYASPIPEPFTFIPEEHRTITLADGSISSSFLEMFGRPTRDTGLESERNNEPTDAQRLYLLNSSDVQRRIRNSPRLRPAYNSVGKNRAEAIRSIYLTVLSREPTAEEMATADAYIQGKGTAAREGAEDLAWALVNSKEFLYRH